MTLSDILRTRLGEEDYATITTHQPARFARIRLHYLSEVDKGHMSLTEAADRAHGDILGWNRHKTSCKGGKA